MLVNCLMGYAHSFVFTILQLNAFRNFFRRPLDFQFVVYVISQPFIRVQFLGPALPLFLVRLLLGFLGPIAPFVIGIFRDFHRHRAYWAVYSFGYVRERDRKST